MSKKEQSKVLLYESENGNVELCVDGGNDTVWATQEQISKIFDTSQQNVSLHTLQIYKDEELQKEATHKESLLVQKEGRRSVNRMVSFYNLDVIIAVGYRINSSKATKFRIWATGVLRRYIIEGFSLNRRKLVGDSEGLEDVYDALEYIESGQGDGKIRGKITLRITKDLTP